MQDSSVVMRSGLMLRTELLQARMLSKFEAVNEEDPDGNLLTSSCGQIRIIISACQECVRSAAWREHRSQLTQATAAALSRDLTFCVLLFVLLGRDVAAHVQQRLCQLVRLRSTPRSRVRNVSTACQPIEGCTAVQAEYVL